VRDRTVFVTYFVVWIVLERRYLREYSQKVGKNRGGKGKEGKKKRERKRERESEP
jgi:hypothetical protein